jgi:hypothetical protein
MGCALHVNDDDAAYLTARLYFLSLPISSAASD